VRDKVKEAKAVCVFREPQFSDRAAAIITEGTSARSAVLDGIGANLPAGPRAYRTLLLNLARDLKACLAG
jgi:zinc transport system substrate-binding protein